MALEQTLSGVGADTARQVARVSRADEVIE
jgi:hypothetical protein